MLEQEIFGSLTFPYRHLFRPDAFCVEGVRPRDDKEVEVGTQAQDAANRRNAKKSTGPRTAEGKARSRLNALTWGLSSLNGVGLLPGESRVEYDVFREEHLAEFNPFGVMEEQLVTEVIDCSWGLRRAVKIEVGILAHGVADTDERYLTELKRTLEVTRATASRKAAGIGDPEDVVEVVDKEMHEHLEDLIAEARGTKETDAARLGGGFIQCADDLTRLARYRTAFLRHRSQALADLRELQAARVRAAKEEA